MCDKADKDRENETQEDVKEGSRKCKRSLKLLRGNERDLKLDMEAAHNYTEKHEHMAVSTPNQIKVGKIGSRKYNFENIGPRASIFLFYCACV